MTGECARLGEFTILVAQRPLHPPKACLPEGTPMKSRHISLAIALVCMVAVPALAGKFNKQLSIGDAAPDWNDLEGTDGGKYSLKELADKEVVIIAFTCNTCPYATDLEDRLIAMAKKFA